VNEEALRSLPRVDRVVAHPALDGARRALGAAAVTELVREAIAEARRVALDGGASCPTADDVAASVARRASARAGERTRRVINATGVVLHTNLGRAPLAAEAVEAVARTAGGYVSLEIDLATGLRGGRGAFCAAPRPRSPSTTTPPRCSWR
jgi:L-seryl-tRNA(Ser) seleniumtransferase